MTGESVSAIPCQVDEADKINAFSTSSSALALSSYSCLAPVNLKRTEENCPKVQLLRPCHWSNPSGEATLCTYCKESNASSSSNKLHAFCAPGANSQILSFFLSFFSVLLSFSSLWFVFLFRILRSTYSLLLRNVCNERVWMATLN